MVAILAEHHAELPAVLEPGALEARHVRLFTPDWWRGYPPQTLEALAACLLAARRNRAAATTPTTARRGSATTDGELVAIRTRHDPAQRREHARSRD